MSIIKSYLFRNIKPSYLIQLLLGSVFLVAGAGKLTHSTEFSGIVAGYGLLPEGPAQIYALLLPWTEIVIGALFILGILTRITSALSIAVIASFITANISTLVSGATGMCGCFGDIIPLTHTQSLTANFIMLAMSTFLLFRPSIKFNTFSVFKKVYPVTAVLLITALVIMSFPAPVLAERDNQAEIPAADDTGVDVIEIDPVVTSDRTEDSVKPTLMYFYNEQCPSCQQQQPIIEALEAEYGDSIDVERINSRDNMDLVREYGITRVPTMIVFNGSPADGGDLCNTFTGYTERDALVAGLNVPAVAIPNPQSTDVNDVPLSVSSMSVQPPDGN